MNKPIAEMEARAHALLMSYWPERMRRGDGLMDIGMATAAVMEALTAAQQPIREGGGETYWANGAQWPNVAPPSAPVGVEALAWLVMYGNRVTGWTNEATKDLILLAEGERLVPVAEITQQPAQAAPGEFVVVDGRSYALDTVRTALLGLAADVAATPPGDDAAGGGS